jgi:hypothetical protein
MPVYLQQRRTTIEGPVAESAAVELLKAGKEAELHDLYTNWTIELDYSARRIFPTCQPPGFILATPPSKLIHFP